VNSSYLQRRNLHELENPEEASKTQYMEVTECCYDNVQVM